MINNDTTGIYSLNQVMNFQPLNISNPNNVKSADPSVEI